MGYSISTPIKSEKAKKKMMAFLEQHYNHTLDLYARGPLDRDRSYDDGLCRIGFDATLTSDYMVSLCAWMALKVGKRKAYPTKANPKVAGPCKYLVYDGYEDWPLLIAGPYRKDVKGYVQIDWVGCLLPKPGLRGYVNRLCDTPNLKTIHAELERLERLWNKLT